MGLQLRPLVVDREPWFRKEWSLNMKLFEIPGMQEYLMFFRRAHFLDSDIIWPSSALLSSPLPRSAGVGRRSAFLLL